MPGAAISTGRRSKGDGCFRVYSVEKLQISEPPIFR
jgi:hypothetical protein